MKRIRPWDKQSRQHSNPLQRNKVDSQQSAPRVKTATTANIPFVEIQGIPYYSDRFYLHRTVYDDSNTSSQQQQKQKQQHDVCHCGARHPPPLLDRSALIQSLQLQAVIWSTYSMEPDSWIREFPSLFGPDAVIPTLVLHGKKGWTYHKYMNRRKNNQQPVDKEDNDDDESYASAEEILLDEDDCDDNSIATQPPDQAVIFPLSPPPPRSEFPNTVHFSEITSSWIPPNDLARVKTVLNDEGCLSAELLSFQQSCRGVHHAKYMLLLETSGALVVVVSTANMTSSRTIDASWIQRFPPITTTKTKTAPSNDFGTVLAHFLQHQMLSTRAHQITIAAFLQRYMGWKSLRDLLRLYSFEDAQVHLMPTVPGGFPLSSSHKATTPPLFGQQRMTQVLKQLTQGSTPCLPKHLFSDQDRLICQPTSFGAEWTVEQMAGMIHTYLEHSVQPRRPQVAALMKRLDIVWPTNYYVQQQVKEAVSEMPIMAFAAATDDNSEASSQVGNAGYLFLSSETFNRIPVDCLSQMVLWETSVPNQQQLTLVPHIKSIARLFHGNDYRIRKDYGIPKCEELFSWFLLTSACLSRGAQGVCSDTTFSYANFELGVLFASRVGNAAKRLYGWKPSQCLCQKSNTVGSTTTRLIHLPIPYCLRPSRYQEEDEEVDFCETPYFHEVTAGSVAVGNMRLTPYGAAMADKLLKREQM